MLSYFLNAPKTIVQKTNPIFPSRGFATLDGARIPRRTAVKLGAKRVNPVKRIFKESLDRKILDYDYKKIKTYTQTHKTQEKGQYNDVLRRLGVEPDPVYPSTGLKEAPPVISLPSQGGLGKIISLNSPKTRNALSLPMLQDLIRAVQKHLQNDVTTSLIVKSVGDTWSSGADMKALAEGSVDKKQYIDTLGSLCHSMAISEKPVVAIGDGIIAGAGISLFLNSGLRIATERSVLAFTDAQNGFFPLGSIYWLSRLPHNLGMYLALTGNVIDGSDLVHVGIADYLIPSGSLIEFENRMSKLDDHDMEYVTGAVMEHCQDRLEPFSLQNSLDDIRQIFSLGNLDEIQEAVNQAAAVFPWAKEAAKNMKQSNPASLKALFESISVFRHLNYVQAIGLEAQLAYLMLDTGSVQEGYKARIVDRRDPSWVVASSSSSSSDGYSMGELPERIPVLETQPMKETLQYISTLPSHSEFAEFVPYLADPTLEDSFVQQHGLWKTIVTNLPQNITKSGEFAADELFSSMAIQDLKEQLLQWEDKFLGVEHDAEAETAKYEDEEEGEENEDGELAEEEAEEDEQEDKRLRRKVEKIIIASENRLSSSQGLLSNQEQQKRAQEKE